MRNGTAVQAEMAGESYAISKAASNAFDDYLDHNSALQVSTEVAILSSLRSRYPDYTVTPTPSTTGVLSFARDGQASADLDLKTEAFSLKRLHQPHSDRTATEPGTMFDEVLFGKYDYQWNDHSFIVYTAQWIQGFNQVRNNYVLHKRDHELVNGRCLITDELIGAASQWSVDVHDEVLVFDQEYWSKNKELWQSVQNASWDDVIMDKDMKETLVNDVEGFFDSKEDYKEFSVPWKRGIIFHGKCIT